MAGPPRVDPKLLGYGDTFGTYAGRNLGDTEIYSTAIDSSLLNDNTYSDVIEFTPFEETVKDYILARLGHPVVRVELNDFQLKTCIEEAISVLDYHAPFWTLQMATFCCSAGINQYVLPTHIAKNLNYVTYKKSLLNLANDTGTIEFDYFLHYFNNNFASNQFNLPDYFLLQQNLEMMRKILSQEGTFDLINGNILQLYPVPVIDLDVVLVFRGLDIGTLHPFYKNWVQKYALAIAKGILGQVRGKYNTLPSPGGGTTLNGDVLMSQSADEMDKLREQLLSEVEEPPTFSLW